MLQKFIATATLLAPTFLSFSQDTTEPAPAKPVFTAYADAYYRHNVNNPGRTIGTFNNFTSFTHSHNSFELGMASVKAEHTIGKVGLTADVGFGKRAEEFSYADDATRFAIKQFHLSYQPWEAIKVTAGSWTTHIGYELVDAYLNRNYSMSYMFSKGPFFHTGIKTDITLGKSGFMVGIANPTDLKSASFSSKFLIGQYSLAAFEDKLKAYLNYQGGKPTADSRMRQLDLVLSSTLTEKFGLGFNGTLSSSKVRENGKFLEASNWWGSAVYVNVDPAPWLGLTLREEYFSDDKKMTDVFSGQTIGGSVWSSTLSANFRVNNLIIIPELRLDHANRGIYQVRDGDVSRNCTSFLMAVAYKL